MYFHSRFFDERNMFFRLILGAIFDIDNEDAEIAFRYAVIRENMYGAKFNLVPNVKIVDATDTFEVEQAGKFGILNLFRIFWPMMSACSSFIAFLQFEDLFLLPVITFINSNPSSCHSKLIALHLMFYLAKCHSNANSSFFFISHAVCSLVAEGVTSIFEAYNSKFKYGGIVGSISNELGIPHFMGHWAPEQPEHKRPFRQFSRNFFPDPSHFARALADLIVDYDWTTFTVIYENDFSLMRLHDILQIHDTDSSPVSVRKLADDGDYMPMLKEIAAYGESRIILDCSQDKVLNVLKQAIPVKMLEDYQSYIITTVDAHIIDFTELQYNRANITTFRLINPGSVDAETAVHDWRQGESRKNGYYNVPPDKIKVNRSNSIIVWQIVIK